ncbi:MAG: hypothetical protein MUF49_27645 [Oculatellaceae cyanobacterium Prado106]|jgi:hypothetical protein|nr:hypothetical protein [Oculatellaceae cyanobacterium Prado106]
MGGWVDGWMGGWVDGWMGGWVDGNFLIKFLVSFRTFQRLGLFIFLSKYPFYQTFVAHITPRSNRGRLFIKPDYGRYREELLSNKMEEAVARILAHRLQALETG